MPFRIQIPRELSMILPGLGRPREGRKSFLQVSILNHATPRMPQTDEGFTEEDSTVDGHRVLGTGSVQEREGRRLYAFYYPELLSDLPSRPCVSTSCISTKV